MKLFSILNIDTKTIALYGLAFFIAIFHPAFYIGSVFYLNEYINILLLDALFCVSIVVLILYGRRQSNPLLFYARIFAYLSAYLFIYLITSIFVSFFIYFFFTEDNLKKELMFRFSIYWFLYLSFFYLLYFVRENGVINIVMMGLLSLLVTGVTVVMIKYYYIDLQYLDIYEVLLSFAIEMFMLFSIYVFCGIKKLRINLYLIFMAVFFIVNLFLFFGGIIRFENGEIVYSFSFWLLACITMFQVLSVALLEGYKYIVTKYFNLR